MIRRMVQGAIWRRLVILESLMSFKQMIRPRSPLFVTRPVNSLYCFASMPLTNFSKC